MPLFLSSFSMTSFPVVVVAAPTKPMLNLLHGMEIADDRQGGTGEQRPEYQVAPSAAPTTFISLFCVDETATATKSVEDQDTNVSLMN